MDTPRAVGLALAALHRGGEDKTTAAVNLSAFLADHGQRTLIVDTDPQGQAAVGVHAFDVVLVDAPPSVLRCNHNYTASIAGKIVSG
ncbi:MULTISPECIES: ParA family protein [unclassified Nonomuraea]|uniref:ParA family protein n=1 Tax=unclassified Nonomuraea TaxID=2593643 RepID=UPI0033FC0F0F